MTKREPASYYMFFERDRHTMMSVMDEQRPLPQAFVRFHILDAPQDSKSSIIDTTLDRLMTYFPSGRLAKLALQGLIDCYGGPPYCYKNGPLHLEFTLKDILYPRSLLFMVTGRILLVRRPEHATARLLAWRVSQGGGMSENISRLLHKMDSIKRRGGTMDGEGRNDVRDCFTLEEWRDVLDDVSERLDDMRSWLGAGPFTPENAEQALRDCSSCYPWMVVFEANPDSAVCVSVL